MISEDGTEIICDRPGCGRSIKSHQWGGRNAANKGEDWFMQKALPNGEPGPAWCPDHHPEWVAEWRAKRAAGIPPEPWRRG